MSEGEHPPVGDAEVLEIGARRDAHRLAWPAAVVALAGTLVAVVVTNSGGAPGSVGSRSGRGSDTPTARTRVGHPLLPVRGGWDLIGRGDRVLVGIDLAAGEITTTPVPELQSTGPVALIAGRDWTMIRPSDYVPGYLIRDGRPTHALTGLLSNGGLASPGPDPIHVWVLASGSRPERIARVGIDGRPTGVQIPVPPGGSPDALPDQTGNLIFEADDGWYDARPDGTTRITTGALLAVGPSRWLTSECGRHRSCATMLINRSDGARRTLDLRVPDRDAQPGVISPDGGFAVRELDRRHPALEIINLATGSEHELAIPVDPFAALQREWPVWSPDSRWLFVIDATGHLDAVDPRTDQVVDLTRRLGAGIPVLRQLAIRDPGDG
ncbi:MAG TPA: hypothetical protein VHU88_20430 [Sporichthyaceae bacterium]|nr:hypothetical protein [Sporichthyaceae bacterium]